MKEIPKEFIGKGFDKLLETCMFANMNESSQMNYVRRMMAERDRLGQMDYAVQTAESRGEARGEAKGLAEGKTQIATAMKAKGYPIEEIAEMTGLTQEQIEQL